MNHPRKDYGCPLRIYAYPDAARPATYTILPPRSWHTFTQWRDTQGVWQCLSVTGELATTCGATAGPHLGQRIHWRDLPPAVQAAVRASFLGEYCPKEEA
jgi:hypothetical protein